MPGRLSVPHSRESLSSLTDPLSIPVNQGRPLLVPLLRLRTVQRRVRIGRVSGADMGAVVDMTAVLVDEAGEEVGTYAAPTSDFRPGKRGDSRLQLAALVSRTTRRVRGCGSRRLHRRRDRGDRHGRNVLAGRCAGGADDESARLSINGRSPHELLRAADRILVFTGAGISTRERYPRLSGPAGSVEDEYPCLLPRVHDLISSSGGRIGSRRWRMPRRGELRRPMRCIAAIVRLEEAGKLEVVVTQNIDGLHAAAGTSREKLIEIHGTNREVECQSCRQAMQSRSPTSRRFGDRRAPGVSNAAASSSRQRSALARTSVSMILPVAQGRRSV